MIVQMALPAVPPPPRPSQYLPEITNRVAQELARRCFQDGHVVAGEDDPDEVAEQIEDALNGTASDEGYEICRILEQQHGWNPDAQLVELMDDAGSYRVRFHHELVEAWVLSHSIKPSFAVGARVKFKNLFRFQDKAEHEGEVVAVNEARAQYTVFVAALGHVRKGTGAYGCILDFEDCYSA